jgi:hypothetical protein
MSMVVTDRLTDELRNSRVGKTEVRDAKVRVEENSEGQLALCIVLVLANPKGRPTWPTADIWGLRREVLEIKTRLEEEHDEVDLPWYIMFKSEKPAKMEAEDLVGALDDDG